MKTANCWEDSDTGLCGRYHLVGKAFYQQADARWWDEKSSRGISGKSCLEGRFSRKHRFFLPDSESWLGVRNRC